MMAVGMKEKEEGREREREKDGGGEGGFGDANQSCMVSRFLLLVGS